MDAGSKNDFFVSYNRHDRQFAEWIATTLEANGYSTIIQAWDFRPGGNFVLDMHQAAANTKRTIAVLSPNYLESEFTQPEWAAAFVKDPTGKDRVLIPVRVAACELTGLLQAIAYIDLVGVTEAEAEQRLLDGVSEERTARFVQGGFPRLGIPSNLPRENKVFVGREEALEELHLRLKPGELTAISSIKGMGGIGKTELALQYALKHLKLRDYPGGVCWLRAREDVRLQVVQFAREKLGLVAPDDRDLGAQVEWCWANWQRDATLIVLDDVQAYADIESFLPKHQEQFRVLLTTRKYLDGSVQSYEIEVLSEAASLELLRRLVEDGRIDRELERSQELCEWLGYLPLGLELVGRYLKRKPGTSIEKVWQRLQEQRLAAKILLDAEPGMTASLGVTAAFELSWQELDEEAQRLAALLSLFALAEIPWSLVQQCLPDVDEEELEELRDEQFVKASLLSFEGGENYQLHQLLREFFGVKREQLVDIDVIKESLCRIMGNTGRHIPQTVTLDVIRQVISVISHLQETAIALNAQLSNDDLIACCHGIASFHTGRFAFSTAEKWYQFCQSLIEQRLGKNHLYVTVTLNDLAGLYYLQGQYSAAELLYLESLEIRQQQLGRNHLYVATILNNLATVYQSQGRYSVAELLYLESLEIRQQQLGQDHLDVGVCLNNLATLYQLQGQYIKAEPLHLKAIPILQKQLGENHPDVAKGLNGLGYLYFLQGRYAEAEPLYLKSRDIWQWYLGLDHPLVATSLSNLADLYQSQGRYEEAESLYQQALSINQEHFGQSHSNVASVLNGLAVLRKLQGRYEEAESLYQQALSINQEHFGQSHPVIASIQINLAELYKSQGRYQEAESLYQQALEIKQQRLGENHLDVAKALNSLAGLYQLQGRYEEGEPLCLQALEIKRQRLGEDHPGVAEALDILAGLYQLQGRYEEGESLYLQALEIKRQRLGEDHPNIAQSLNNLASFYFSQSRHKEAETLYIQALRIAQKTLGESHPNVAVVLNGLATIYTALEQHSEAEKLYLQAISITYHQLGEAHPSTENTWGCFILFLKVVAQKKRTSELSDHPMTQSLLQQLQTEES